jgi:nudix-type nucleoside diphosphatase (YffH/AdpP family)
LSEPKVKVIDSEVLSDDWAKLTRYTIAFTRSDGTRQTQVRQVYSRGNGAAILPIDRRRGTVLLIRQFRMPAFVNPRADGASVLIEACAGLLDENDPETAIVKEAREELGYRLHRVRQVFDLYTSPGSVAERLIFFVAEYGPEDKIDAGGGEIEEGEDIEVLELGLDEALRLTAAGEIADAKTILLLQYAKLQGLAG